ncbi:MAG: bifunctional nuclease family protein [Phycisphaerae bacterium]|nr:bifunctional nuclease family protein [Phycisphaerae bacterium]NUQ50715.1 bifunctional nuclease family protein [Phycisphaerae bacterium]
MDLAQIRISDVTEQQIIVLRERNGNRYLHIVIGLPEAVAIQRRIKGETPQRPLTHDLLANTIEQLSGEIEKVVISDLHEHTFFARLIVRRAGELIEIDSRPSDAIAVAAGLDVPIYVAEHVLKEAAQTP